MQIEVSKSELSEALRALGKLVTRTSPIEVFRSLKITGQGNTISFQPGLDFRLHWCYFAPDVGFCTQFAHKRAQNPVPKSSRKSKNER